MPRKRNPENKGLPNRWRKIHGAYFYQVPPGMEHLWDDKKQFRLGKTLPEAYREWADRIGHVEKARTIGQLLQRYEHEVIPTKAKNTQDGNFVHSKRLRAVFGDMPLTAIKPQHIYQYVDRRAKKVEDEEGKKTGGGVIARREVALLSHAFTKAVEWGYIGRHPFKGEVRLKGEKPRTRYVEDWEIDACLSIRPPRGADAVTMVQAYIRLKLLIGLRQGDMLRLRIDDLKEDGIHVTPRKTALSTGKSIIIVWTAELRDAVNAVLEARPVKTSAWLFCTRRGEPYTDDDAKSSSSGFRSIWQRFMTRVLKETEVTTRFTEHDLRAKTGSDFETDEEASQLLTHGSTEITRRVYRRKATKVQPLKRS